MFLIWSATIVGNYTYQWMEHGDYTLATDISYFQTTFVLLLIIMFLFMRRFGAFK
jgi:hypothetical protein